MRSLHDYITINVRVSLDLFLGSQNMVVYQTLDRRFQRIFYLTMNISETYLGIYKSRRPQMIKYGLIDCTPICRVNLKGYSLVNNNFYAVLK